MPLTRSTAKPRLRCRTSAGKQPPISIDVTKDPELVELSAPAFGERDITEIDNDLTMWVSKTDPTYVTYERFRAEFGGQRNLIVALQSKELFSASSLEFIRASSE